jgi:hypothetical protein
MTAASVIFLASKLRPWGESAPGDARQLIGERDRQHIASKPPSGRLDPGFEPVTLPALRLDQHGPRRLNQQNAQVAIAAFGYLAKDRAVPRRGLFRDKPSRAAKSRPLMSASPAPTAATIALEMIGPIPGTLINRSQPASWRASTSISPDRPSIRSSSRRQSPAKSSMTRTMRGDRTSQRVARMPGNPACKKRSPCRTAT